MTRISYLSDANKSNCSSCLQMSTTSKWIAPGACTNGWSAPTTSRIENVVKTHGRGHKYHYSQRLAQSAHRGERLGETLKKYAESILAYFDRPGTSNGPTEAINGRLEHLRGTALGFRNLTNYIARCLLKSGGFRNQLHP
ncbi:transposase (plasmid) [Pseudomonas aeruginosa]|uniref:transposase n=1 Tax=Pseudomonas aeruginosa TaxID=287 RepID=UPI00308226FE